MFNIIIKDLKNIIYDRKVLAVLLLMPIVLMTILGFSLKGVFTTESGLKEVKIAVVKQYDFEREMSKAKNKVNYFISDSDSNHIDFEVLNPEKMFFESFLGAEELEFLHYDIVDYEEAIKKLENNQIVGIVILPEDYIYNSVASMTFSTRNKTVIKFIKNEENGFIANIVEDILESYTEMVNGIVAQKNVHMATALKNGIKDMNISEDMLVAQEDGSITVMKKSVTGEALLDSFHYYAVGIMTMFLLYAASHGGSALLEEKNNFTAQRLEVIGVGVMKTATANMIVIILVTSLQTIVTIIYSTLVLKVHWGSLTTVGLGMMFTGFCIGGIGMFVAVLTYISEYPPVARVFETVIIQFMSLVGGSFIPIVQLPKVLRHLQGFSANGNALNIYLNAMTYRPIRESYSYFSALGIIGGVMIVMAYTLLLVHEGRGKV